MHPRKLVRDSVGFAATQYVVRVALMLRALIAMRLLSPMAYGAWNAITLLFDYGTLAPLSTQQGLDQAVPGRIVAGESTALDRLKRAGLFNILALTALMGILVLVWDGGHGRLSYNWGLRGILAALGCVFLINLSNYHLTLLRSHGNISAVSVWFVLQGGVGTVLGLALIPALGVWGLLLGWIAGTALGLLYVRRQGRGVVPLVPLFSPGSLFLLRTGLPMYLYTASSVVLRSLDRLVILRFLGTEKLGYYSLAVMVLGLLLYLPDSVAFVLYPHFLRRYHSHGNRPEAIRDQALRALQALAVAVPALCGLSYLVARDGALLVLPRYLPGISAARIMCFAAGAIALANLSSVLLMTLGRQRALVIAAGVITLLGAGLDYAMVRLGYDITGVAWATLATFTVSGLALPWLTLTALEVRPGERLLWLARLTWPLALSLVLSSGLDRLLPWYRVPGAGIRMTRVTIGVVSFIVIYGGLCLPLLRGMGLRQLASEFNLRLPAVLRRPAGNGREGNGDDPA